MIFVRIGGRLVRTRLLRIDVQKHDFRINAADREMSYSPERESRIKALKNHYSQPKQRRLLEQAS